TSLLVALHLEERVKRLEERAAPHEQRTWSRSRLPKPLTAIKRCPPASLQIRGSGFLTVCFAALRSVEKYPRREIVGKFYEAMLLAGGDEQNISRTKADFFSFPFKASCAGSDHVNLVARVGVLMIGAARRIQLHRKRAVPKQLDGTLAVRAGQLLQAAQCLQVTVNDFSLDLHGDAGAELSSAFAFGFHTPTMIPIKMQPSSG